MAARAADSIISRHSGGAGPKAVRHRLAFVRGRGFCRSCGAVCAEALTRGREGPTGNPMASLRLITSGGGGRTAGGNCGGHRRRSRCRSQEVRRKASGCRSARAALVFSRAGYNGRRPRAVAVAVFTPVQLRGGGVLATASIGRASTKIRRRRRYPRRRAANCGSDWATSEGRYAPNRFPIRLAYRYFIRGVTRRGRSPRGRLQNAVRKSGRRRVCPAILAITGGATGRRASCVSGRCCGGLRDCCRGRGLMRVAAVGRGSRSSLHCCYCTRSAAGR